MHPCEHSTCRFIFSFVTFSFPEWAPCIWPGEQTVKKQGFRGDRARLGSLTLMDQHKREWKRHGERGSSENMWDIFTSLTQYSRWDCSETDVKHTSATVGPIGRELYFFIFMYCCYCSSCVCSSVCAERTTLVSWGPWESETAERPDQDRNKRGKKRRRNVYKKKKEENIERT